MVRRKGGGWIVRLFLAGGIRNVYAFDYDLNVQFLYRNQTKYTQGKNSELRAILEKAKKRAETKKSASQEQLDLDMSQV